MLADRDDNCPGIANADPHDEDADTVGDLCDNCPHISNTSKDNTDQDNLGEACDDSTAVDCLIRFDPFTSSTPPLSTKGTWITQGDAIAQTNSPGRINGGLELVLNSSISEIPAGHVAFRTHNMAVAFDYVVIVERRAAAPWPPL